MSTFASSTESLLPLAPAPSSSRLACLVQIIQYIDMIKPDSTTSIPGYYLYPADGFGDDEKAGHGTHTAGTAAGATLNTPAETVTCGTGETLSCVGGCIDATGSDDDLVSYYEQYADIDRLCPMLECDDDSELCLDDDVGATLAANGGIAQGAKLAIFDIFSVENTGLDSAGNGLWEPCLEAGCKIHSNSWGGDGLCLVYPNDILYDEFMYKVTPKTATIFPLRSRRLMQFVRAACSRCVAQEIPCGIAEWLRELVC